MATIISHSPAETFAYGRQLAVDIRAGDTLALCGDLGAGKTHLAKGIAAALGCTPEDVTSPTFTLVHEYTGGRLPIFHFDFYRLESGDEALALGLDDYLGGRGIALVEWADKFAALLPDDTLWITLREIGLNLREITTGSEPL